MPIVWYEGTGTVNKKFLYSDNQGSIIATADGSGNTVNISTYDAYGNRTNSNPSTASRFGYTGQVDLSELGLLYYKARMYDPKLGRFLQTDPIGYGDGMNWYTYVGGDPINMVDPSGMVIEDCPPPECVTVTGHRKNNNCSYNAICYPPGSFNLPEQNPIDSFPQYAENGGGGEPQNKSKACSIAREIDKKTKGQINSIDLKGPRENSLTEMQYQAGRYHAASEQAEVYRSLGADISGVFVWLAGETISGSRKLEGISQRSLNVSAKSIGRSYGLWDALWGTSSGADYKKAVAYDNRANMIASCGLDNGWGH